MRVKEKKKRGGKGKCGGRRGKGRMEWRHGHRGGRNRDRWRLKKGVRERHWRSDGEKRSTLPPSGLSGFQQGYTRADQRTFGQHDWLTEEIQLSTHRFALIDRSGLDLSEQSPVACACLCFVIYSVIRASWRAGLNKMISLDWSLAVSECARAHWIMWWLCGWCEFESSLQQSPLLCLTFPILALTVKHLHGVSV